MGVLLAKALWARGLRYRKNVKGVFGRPDLTLKRHRLAIFVDGEFFHGKGLRYEQLHNQIAPGVLVEKD